MAERLNPAWRVIGLLTDPDRPTAAEVARILGIDRSNVSRWYLPKDKGGRGGVVPAEYQQKLLDYALEHGKPLTPADFFDWPTKMSDRRQDGGDALVA